MKKTIIFLLACVLGIFSNQIMGQTVPSALDISPLLIGENAPDATISDSKGGSLSFLSLIKDKPTVVIFYRGDWCPNCITHFNQEISPNLAELKSLGYDLVAISPDSPENLVLTSGKVKIDQAMFYSDANGSLSKAFGIASKQDDRMKDMLIKSSGGKNLEAILPVPAVYVIGTDKKIIFEYINPTGPQSALRMKWKLLNSVLQGLK